MDGFNPLKSFTVDGVGRVIAKGLIVIVGPNSGGKTRLLKDVRGKILGATESLIVCSDVELDYSVSFEELVESFVNAKYIRKVIEKDGSEYLQHWSPEMEGAHHRWKINAKTAKAHFANIKSQNRTDSLQFIQHFGQFFLAPLFIGPRLAIASEKEGIDASVEAPNHELQSLHINQAAKRKFEAEILRVFDRAAWSDGSRMKRVCIRVSNRPVFPTPEQRNEVEEMNKYRTIDEDGDGLRSYAAIVISLLASQRPVMFIDEPELCLHPPQAYAMGQFIGRNATSLTDSVLVATHSSHVLRGIVETAEEVTVLRLVNTEGRFSGTLLPNEVLKESLNRPSTKIETILDGIFSQAVTIVESEGDRVVYGATLERLRETTQQGDISQHEAHFVSMGGLSGIASARKLFSDLKIPTAIIADLDLISNPEMKAILRVICPSDAASIWADCQKVMELMCREQPITSVEEVKKKLSLICERSLDWQAGDNDRVRGELGNIADDLAWTSNLKRGGLSRFHAESHNEIRQRLSSIIDDCAKHGLFLAHVGTLEYWVESLMNGEVSKKRKAEWANEAAVRIKAATPTNDDIWEFVRAVVRYQREEIEKAASFT